MELRCGQLSIRFLRVDFNNLRGTECVVLLDSRRSGLRFADQIPAALRLDRRRRVVNLAKIDMEHYHSIDHD